MLFLTLNLLFSPEIHWISSITISSVGYMFYFFCHLSPSQLKNILKPALSLINLRKNSHHGYLLWVPPLSSYQSSWKSSLYFLSLTHHFHSLCKPLQSGSCARWRKSSLVTTAGKSNSEELSSLTDLCCPWLCPSPWSSFLPWFWGAFLVLTPLPRGCILHHLWAITFVLNQTKCMWACLNYLFHPSLRLSLFPNLCYLHCCIFIIHLDLD